MSPQVYGLQVVLTGTFGNAGVVFDFPPVGFGQYGQFVIKEPRCSSQCHVLSGRDPLKVVDTVNDLVAVSVTDLKFGVVLVTMALRSFQERQGNQSVECAGERTSILRPDTDHDVLFVIEVSANQPMAHPVVDASFIAYHKRFVYSRDLAPFQFG
ncbi:hypothetical protein [Xanthomonas phage RTH11]|nr:hypothetical protein [Xanthomonas phage RTH11]